jgi:hypothetical protein
MKAAIAVYMHLGGFEMTQVLEKAPGLVVDPLRAIDFVVLV